MAIILSEFSLSQFLEHVGSLESITGDEYKLLDSVYFLSFPAQLICQLFDSFPEPIKLHSTFTLKRCIALWSMSQDRQNALVNILNVLETTTTTPIFQRWFCVTFLDCALGAQVTARLVPKESFGVEIRIQIARAYLHQGESSMEAWRTFGDLPGVMKVTKSPLRQLVFAYGLELLQAQSITQYEISELDYQTYDLQRLLDFIIHATSSSLSLDQRNLIETLSDLIPRDG